jgi:hypothetical protein
MVKIIPSVLAMMLVFCSNVMAQRTFLTSPTIFYKAASGGSDNGSCSQSAPCATFTHIWQTLRQNYDLSNGTPIMIEYVGSPHTDQMVCSGQLLGQVNARQVEVIGQPMATGSTASPGTIANAIVIATGSDAVDATNCMMTLGGLALENAGNCCGQGDLTSGQGGEIDLIGNISFLSPQSAPAGSGILPMNHVTAGLGLVIFQPPGLADPFGITGSGYYEFHGYAQCVMLAGEMGGEILWNGNGENNLWSILVETGWSLGFECAQNNAIVQAAIPFSNFSMPFFQGPKFFIRTGGQIDTFHPGNTSLNPPWIPGTSPGSFVAVQSAN